MREIKFRGQKEDGIWKYGFCQFTPKASGAPGCVAYIVNLDENGCFQTHSVIPKTIGQFTGLKDENGQEGFFDDIVEDEGDRYIVQWDDGEGVAYLKAILGNSIDFSIQAITYRKIIGNIHENPELLNG